MIHPLRSRELLRMGRVPQVWSVNFGRSKQGVRGNAAVGLVANVSKDGSAVRNDFDRISIFQRPIFNATWDPYEHCWIDLVPADSPAFSWSPTQPYREVVYRCTPFWYRIQSSPEYLPTTVYVADRPLDGYTLAPMFQNGEQPVYRPCFEMALGEDGLPHSRAGLAPLCSSGTDLMQKAHRFSNAARTERLADWFSDVLLLLVEFATWSLGSVMSGQKGSEPDPSGSCLPHLNASSGSLSTGGACAWRGKENPWKGVNSFLCDVMLRKTTVNGTPAMRFGHLKDVSRFSGNWNGYYTSFEQAYVSGESGTKAIKAYALQSGLLYPIQATGTSEDGSTRGWSYLRTDHSNGRPTLVAVGGGNGNGMLENSVEGLPWNFEAVDQDDANAKKFGARLILDEKTIVS